MFLHSSTRLALVMVGLPARGKTYMARRIARFLRWKGIRSRVFNVGNYRRARLGTDQPHSFFDPNNTEGRAAREAVAMAALDDVIDWLNYAGEVAIYDATNITDARRARLKSAFSGAGVEVVFIESICDDARIVDRNVRATKVRSPDYQDVDPEEAVEDFRRRIEHYERAYEPLTDADRYIRVVDFGKKIVANRLQELPPKMGWLLGRLVSLLSCLHAEPQQIFLSRHGQSEFNRVGRIGGDSGLTSTGDAYAGALAGLLRHRLSAKGHVEVWTSTLRRTRETALYLPWKSSALKILDEIDAGECDGMTYEEIRDQLPLEFRARATDKLRYRYPRGESYVDLSHRLEPIILEVERHRGPLVIIAHQAVLRVLYGYLMDTPTEQIPYLRIPLNTVIQLTPTAYGAEEKRTLLGDGGEHRSGHLH